MYQEILKKRSMLNDRKPYSTEKRIEIKEAGLRDLIFTSLHLEGSCIKKEQVQQILREEFVPEVILADHMAIQQYRDLAVHMESLLELQSDLSLQVIKELHGFNSEVNPVSWRRCNPLVYTLDYNPPPWQEVDERMEFFIRWSYGAEEAKGNAILKAAYLHHKFLEIYPFEQNCEGTARILMYYSLLREGYPLFQLRLSEREYNQSIVDYLKHQNVEPFYQALERSVFNQLDVLLQMTEE